MKSLIWTRHDAPYLDIFLDIDLQVETGAAWRIEWTHDSEEGGFNEGDWEFSPDFNAPYDHTNLDVPADVLAEYERRKPDIHAEFLKFRLGEEQHA